MSNKFDWKSVENLVRTVAPTIANVLGGPLAGLATQAISAAILGKPDGTQDELTSALAVATPDILLKLKQAEQEFTIKMEEIGLKREQLSYGDRDSARKREIDVKDKTPSRLAYTIIGGFLTVTIAQLVGIMIYPEQVAKIPPQGWLLVGNVTGYLAGEAKAASAYYFGASPEKPEKLDIRKGDK